MKKHLFKIHAFGLLLLVFSLPISAQSASIYRCVDSQGSVMLTDNIPTNPDYKCTFAASYSIMDPEIWTVC